MLIEFRCRNHSGFDAAKGTYTQCGHPIIVSEEKIGDWVKCPKCHHESEVPTASAAASQSAADTAADSERPAGPAKGPSAIKQKQPQPNQRPSSRSQSKAPRPTADSKRSNSAAGQQPDDELKLSEPIRRPTSDLGTLEFDDARVSKKVLEKDKRKRCENCGGLLGQTKRCPACGHIEQKFEKAEQSLDEIKIQLAGFQRWFSETMSEGVSLKVVEYGAHISVGILTVVFALLSLFGIGGVVGFGLCFAILTFAGFYVAFVVKGHQLASDPRARLAWFQKPFWNGILYLARKQRWQAYDERFKGRTIIDCRGEGLTDDRILDLEEINTCEVLDLENTPVTDKGLLHLYALPNLHCVVLRKSGVTHEGVFRLQQSRPALWIWY